MNQKNSRNFIYFTMVIFSMVMNTLAPLMTSIQERFSISVAVSSILPFISTLGTMISNFVGGFFITDRYNFIIGNYYSDCGFNLFAFAVNFPMIVIAVFLLGFATGGVFLTLTSSYSHLDGKYQNFGIYNAFFGFGGIFAPLLVSLFLRLNLDFRFIYFFHLVLAIVILIWVLSLKPIPNIIY